MAAIDRRSIVATASDDDWDLYRLSLGLPDGSRDLESEKSVLLEAGFDELNGVSWTKGCYMGQELTARTKYRGLVKRRLVPVQIDRGRRRRLARRCSAMGAKWAVRSARGRRGMALSGSDWMRCRVLSPVTGRPLHHWCRTGCGWGRHSPTRFPCDIRSIRNRNSGPPNALRLHDEFAGWSARPRPGSGSCLALQNSLQGSKTGSTLNFLSHCGVHSLMTVGW